MAKAKAISPTDDFCKQVQRLSRGIAPVWPNVVDALGLDEALKEYVKQKIGVWKYPRWIEAVDSLPKTATGKIQRFKLRDGAPS